MVPFTFMQMARNQQIGGAAGAEDLLRTMVMLHPCFRRKCQRGGKRFVLRGTVSIPRASSDPIQELECEVLSIKTDIVQGISNIERKRNKDILEKKNTKLILKGIDRLIILPLRPRDTPETTS